ncbi:MAG: hypothetical protein ACRD8U_16585 [Pyrinomonadaceae bacterium]
MSQLPRSVRIEDNLEQPVRANTRNRDTFVRSLFFGPPLEIAEDTILDLLSSMA